jgi:hypothetical protein
MPYYGAGGISAKPSFASIPDSTRGLLAAPAPIAGYSVTAKPSLASLPESPRSPQQFKSTWSLQQPLKPPQPPGAGDDKSTEKKSDATNKWKTNPLNKKEQYKKNLSSYFVCGSIHPSIYPGCCLCMHGLISFV